MSGLADRTCGFCAHFCGDCQPQDARLGACYLDAYREPEVKRLTDSCDHFASIAVIAERDDHARRIQRTGDEPV